VEHAPPANVLDLAVLVCGPLGYEDTAAYRPLRHLADQLATAGHLTLRLDWPGLGDSAGEDTDPDLAERALAAIHRGVAHLRARGAPRVAILGVRGGALYALAAAAAEELILWAPPARGKAFLREERTFHKLAARAYGSPPPDARPPPPGSVEAGGFLYNPAVVAAIEAIDPVERVRAHPPRRVLVLEREHTTECGALVEALHALNAEVATGTATGLGDLLENPYHSRLSDEVAAQVLRWCRQGAAPATLRAPPPAPGALSLSGITERPWSLATSAGALCGVLCEPVRAAPGVPWTLFFNAGGIRRAGPNRLWTRAARALAAAGRPSIRFDVRDVGDSDGVHAPHPDLEAMYAEDSIEDALAAYDAVRALGAAAVDVVGLCSGAFLGVQVAARRPVRRAVLFNGLAFIWNDEARANGMTSQIGRSLFDGRRWRRLLAGRIDARALATAVWKKGRLRAAAGVARLRGEKPPDEVTDLLRQVLDRGTELHLVCSEGDPSIEYLRAHEDPRRRPNLAVLPGVDHTIRPLWAHASVIRWITGTPTT